MSVQALSWVLDHSPAQGTDRLVLLSIANHAGQSPDDGAWTAWPGVALMQREARLERSRTVQDALRRLVDAGHLARLVNGAPDERIPKHRRPNLYRILLANGVTCGVIPCRWCGVTPDAGTGDAATSDGVTPERPMGCRDASPKPSEEPSLEPSGKPTTRDRFPEFWAVYPKGTYKRDAKLQWDKEIRAGADPDEIIDGAGVYATSERVVAGFVMDPHRWLKARRWTDEHRAAPPVDLRSERQKKRDAFWAEQMGAPPDTIDTTASVLDPQAINPGGTR